MVTYYKSGILLGTGISKMAKIWSLPSRNSQHSGKKVRMWVTIPLPCSEFYDGAVWEGFLEILEIINEPSFNITRGGR